MIGNRASLISLHAAGILLALTCFTAATVFASDKQEKKQRPPSPVRTAPVEKRDVSNQISMVGTVEAQATSIVARSYDEALSKYTALTEELNQRTAEVERLDYQLSQTTVAAPLSGFVSKEHTFVGQWIDRGGSVVFGGLFISTVFTIFLIPALFSLLLDALKPFFPKRIPVGPLPDDR